MRDIGKSKKHPPPPNHKYSVPKSFSKEKEKETRNSRTYMDQGLRQLKKLYTRKKECSPDSKITL